MESRLGRPFHSVQQFYPPASHVASKDASIVCRESGSRVPAILSTAQAQPLTGHLHSTIPFQQLSEASVSYLGDHLPLVHPTPR